MKKQLIRFILMGLLFFIYYSSTFCQELDKDKQYNVVTLAFYNLENLFDTLDTEDVRDTEFTPAGEKNWNTEKYNKKLANMAAVISQLGTEINPDGPAILGVCEIENRSVLEDLIKTGKLKEHNYQIVHYDSPDKRGIDVGLIYQPKYFKVTSSKSYTLTIDGLDDFYTRDQLLVSGLLHGEPIHVMVSHWPSRRGGQKGSNFKRVAAADLGRSVIDSILNADPKAKIFYMGDLNDDPVDESVKKHLLTEAKAENVSGKIMFNPMEPLFKKGIGTLAWRDVWNLFDQILMTSSLVEKDYSSFRYYGVKVFNKDFLKQQSGKYQGYPYRTFVGSSFKGGYSDHFPVYTFLIKEKK
ncbi:MAG: endonuclease [Bacteroidetes bacterium]|nr:endonuclease/exonuclease/phosphatase family protein [Bacteroidia bacterium]PCH68124.1 MAG: endonuclease [Bacteroidota bacterium]